LSVSATAAAAHPAGPLFTTPAWRYALVFWLYCYQGLVAGFALTAVPNHFAALGATATQVGAHIAMVGLPWILQPAWGPVVDRCGTFRMGRRRFWIVVGLLASLVALSRLLLLGEVAAAELATISAVLLVHSGFATLIDTATDGMIIDRVPVERLGLVNAVTRSGFVFGIAVGAALFAWLLQVQGLRIAVTVLVGIGGIALVLPLLVREQAADAWLSLRQRTLPAGGQTSFAALFRQLGRTLQRRTTLALLVGCFAVDAAAAMFRVPLAVALIQQEGWDAAALSRLQAAVALGSGTMGALAIGWWTDRVGPERILAVLLGLCAVGHAGAGTLLLFPSAPWPMLGPWALGMSSVLPALVFVALAPLVMQRSRGPAAATSFALFMAALNLGDVCGSAVAGTATSAAGLSAVGMATGVLFAVGAAVAHRLAWPQRRAT